MEASVTLESEYYKEDSSSKVNGAMPLRLVIVGMTATGKSALGNNILGVENKIPTPFMSKTSPVPVTTDLEMKDGNVFDCHVSIVDTPGLFETTNPTSETEVLKQSISLIPPGPNAILLLLKIGRFTEEFESGVKRMMETIGENGSRFLIVVFTHVDALDDNDDDDDSEIRLHEFVNKISGPCRALLDRCNMRYIGINNKYKSTSEDNRHQIKQLLSIIEKLSEDNGGECYTHESLEDAVNIRGQKQGCIQECFDGFIHCIRSCSYYISRPFHCLFTWLLLMFAAMWSCLSAIWSCLSAPCKNKCFACFASSSRVRVQDSQGLVITKSLDDLAVGDLAESYDLKAKYVTYSPVYYIIYKGESDHMHTLRELIYRDSEGMEHSLKLHDKHLLYATINPTVSLDSGSPPSTPVMAEKVNVGDVLWVIDDNSGYLLPRRVIQVAEIVTNVRHPMTMNHTIIVEGVLASVHKQSEWLMRRATAPLRLHYKITSHWRDLWQSKKAV